MPCNLCARPQGDGPGQCRDLETWACKDAQIARLQAQVVALEAQLLAEQTQAQHTHTRWREALDLLRAQGWREIGVGADPAIGQWCVLYDGDPGATYPYHLVRAEAEEWGSVRPLAYWTRHAGDRWLPLEAPGLCARSLAPRLQPPPPRPRSPPASRRKRR